MTLAERTLEDFKSLGEAGRAALAVMRIDALEKQRNELLAAAKAVREAHSPYMERKAWLQMREAIAKAERELPATPDRLE